MATTTENGNVLLPQVDDVEGAPDGFAYVAGDIRVNENPGLTTIHVLFVREHNRIAAQLRTAANVNLDEQQIYDHTRYSCLSSSSSSRVEKIRLRVAMLHCSVQAHRGSRDAGHRLWPVDGDHPRPLHHQIHWSPCHRKHDHLQVHSLANYFSWNSIGKAGLHFRPYIDPSIRNEFATSAFRFGHTLIQVKACK